jgi:choline dehydrogenase
MSCNCTSKYSIRVQPQYNDRFKHNKYNDDGIKTYKADYVIIGTGTAGSLLARLLSDDHISSVISVEAGENKSNDEAIRDSAFAGIEFGLEQNFFSSYFWQIDTVAQGGLVSDPITGTCKNESGSVPVSKGNCIKVPGFPAGTGTIHELPERQHYTGGRILGGGSSINGQQYVRGTPELYKKMVEFTDSQLWDPTNVLDAFKSIEKYIGKSRVPQNHGYNGSVSIRQAPNIPTMMAEKFVQATELAIGIKQFPDDDYNGFFPESIYNFGSFTKWQLFQRADKTRESSNTAFLNRYVMSDDGKGIGGRKLRVMLKTTVTRILWEHRQNCKPRAIGVEALRNGRMIRILTNNRLIISAGILSAHLLQQNGIGPSIQLESVGIKTIVNNPNVGMHMTNHLLLTAVLSANKNDIGIPPDDIQSLYTGGAFLPPLLPEDNMNLHGYQIIGANPSPGTFLLIVIYLQPKSEGIIREQSTDPMTFPLIDTKYFVDARDVEAFRLAFEKYIVPISNKLNQIDNNYQLLSPAIEVINDPDAFKDYAIDSYDFAHHWQGMCRMGKTIKDSVVNGHGEVHGTDNLMVIDTEIAPLQSDGNTAAPAFLFAWQIGQYLLSQNNICNQYSKYHF